MSYDAYDAPRERERTTRRSYYQEERRDDRDPRYLDTRDNYLRVHSRDLVPRAREDSDLSVEEIHRDFPPPGYRDVRRARSAEPGYYDDYDDRRSHYSKADREYDYDDRRRSKKAESVYYEEEERKRHRVLSNQEKIIAAIAGAALAVGGKELYDRREAKQDGGDVHRNIMSSGALAAAGALAGYQGADFYNKRAEKSEKKSTHIVHKGRDGRVTEYISDEEDDKQKKGHKNFLESAIAAAGLGGAVKALTGGGKDKDDDRKSDTRSRRGSRSRSPQAKGGEGVQKMQKAAMASLIAGATEAFRVSKEPGAWKGEKAKRILTAAAGAATIDAAQNPEKGGSKLGLAESVIGGLIGNRMIHGSRKDIIEDKKTGRSRSRSRARSEGGHGGVSGLAALATAGLGAVAGKKILDNRERSRSRRRDESYDSRDESPDRRKRSRSRSVVDGARRGLAKLGIGNGPDDERDRDRDRSRRRGHDDDDDYDSRGPSRRHRGRDDDYYEDSRSYARGGRDDYDDDRSLRERSRSRGPRRERRRGNSRGSVSSSDLGDSDDDEKRAKKMRDRRR